MPTGTDESGFRRHLDIINRYTSMTRRMKVTPLTREAYEGYLSVLEEDFNLAIRQRH